MISFLHNHREEKTLHKTAILQLPPGQAFLQEMLSSSFILGEDWEALPQEKREEIVHCEKREQILAQLVEQKLLTEYQAARIEARTTFGLILGNYRVIDRLGAGGMGVVFKGEHLLMRRLVAIKVLALVPDQSPILLRRFYTEMRAIAQLQHPNIVGAVEAGKISSPETGGQTLHYFVMEYVPGQDLEELVRSGGPLPPAKACDLIHQIASALAEAHKQNLVHRDIKPSNALVTPEGQVKLLDFGLARHFRHRMTEAGALLGSIDYMAPEQANDAGSVDIRADIYGLGGTMFWCLTGRTPFTPKDNIALDLAARLTESPPSVRSLRPEISPGLDALVTRMLATKPDDRFPNPQAVMRALLPFLQPELRDHLILPTELTNGEGQYLLAGEGTSGTQKHRILIVDDDLAIRNMCRYALQFDGHECHEAANGELGLEALRARVFDLVLLDIDMPKMTGTEVCRLLRETPPCPYLKIIMFSGRASADEMAKIMLAGADDYLTKPLSIVQLQARVKAALRLKEAQDRSDVLNRHLLTANHDLEQNLTMRDCDLVHARNALVLALAKLVEHRDTETGAHLVRLQRYSRCLAEEAATSPTFAGQIDQYFIEMLVCCAPLHDIGKVGLPDHILLKPGKLDANERIIMQAHTIIGADTLKAVANQHGSAMAFLHMAIDIVRHHHERFDGRGYPDGLIGSAIPLSARLVAIGDVYDALRSRRVYKPALSHSASMQVMAESFSGQFDPALLQIFHKCSSQFDRIFREVSD